jgi:hypothetical protein
MSKAAWTSYGEARLWRSVRGGTGGERVASAGSPTSHSIGELAEAEQQDGRETLRLLRPDESSAGTLMPLTALARVALARGQRRCAGLMWGAVEAERGRGPNRGWDRGRAERAGWLLLETDPEFVAGV